MHDEGHSSIATKEVEPITSGVFYDSIWLERRCGGRVIMKTIWGRYTRVCSVARNGPSAGPFYAKATPN